MEDWQMTPEERSLKYERIRKEKAEKRKKGMKSLTKAQLKVLKVSHNNLRKIINDLDEMNDLYMSDIKKLNRCFYDIGNEFLFDNSAYWNYEDPDADDAEE